MLASFNDGVLHRHWSVLHSKYSACAVIGGYRMHLGGPDRLRSEARSANRASRE